MHFGPNEQLTCVLQAGRAVGRWREAVGPGLEGRRSLVADALRPLPALHGQAGSAGLVAVHAAGCRQSERRTEARTGDGRGGGDEAGRAGESPRPGREDWEVERKGTGSDRGTGANRNMGAN